MNDDTSEITQALIRHNTAIAALLDRLVAASNKSLAALAAPPTPTSNQPASSPEPQLQPPQKPETVPVGRSIKDIACAKAPVGAMLAVPNSFTLNEVTQALDLVGWRASQVVSTWVRMKWVARLGGGAYQKSGLFGTVPERLAAPVERPARDSRAADELAADPASIAAMAKFKGWFRKRDVMKALNVPLWKSAQLLTAWMRSGFVHYVKFNTYAMSGLP